MYRSAPTVFRLIATERKSDFANLLRNFFLNLEQTISKPYLYHVLGFLKYISGQSHLPKLDDHGVMEYNQSRGVVEPTELLAVVAPTSKTGSTPSVS